MRNKYSDHIKFKTNATGKGARQKEMKFTIIGEDTFLKDHFIHDTYICQLLSAQLHGSVYRH